MQLSLLSIGPKITRKEGKLVARTSVAAFLASLTLLHRTVIIDPVRQVISIRRRLFWFFTRRTKIPFERVQSIVYTYDDWNSNTSMGLADDSKDCFTVKLKLWNERLVHLFHFYGEGTFVNNSPFPDWCYWDEFLLDLSGTQESESRSFVDLLQKMLNVPVTRQ